MRSENSRFALHVCSTKRTESRNCMAMKIKWIEMNSFGGGFESNVV